MTFPPRFEKFVRRTDSCWLWAGCVVRRYGMFGWNGKSRRANRVAWEIANGGPVPDGMFVLHRCDNPLCVRPDHLFLGTQADNVRDMHQKGRAGSTAGRRKAFCCHGHEQLGDNVRVRGNGKRDCWPCRREARRQYVARRRAERSIEIHA